MMASFPHFQPGLASPLMPALANPGRSAKCLPGSFDPRRLSSSRVCRGRTPVVVPCGRGADLSQPEKTRPDWSGGG